jgi:hypothetical protein
MKVKHLMEIEPAHKTKEFSEARPSACMILNKNSVAKEKNKWCCAKQGTDYVFGPPQLCTSNNYSTFSYKW